MFEISTIGVLLFGYLIRHIISVTKSDTITRNRRLKSADLMYLRTGIPIQTYSTDFHELFLSSWSEITQFYLNILNFCFEQFYHKYQQVGRTNLQSMSQRRFKFCHRDSCHIHAASYNIKLLLKHHAFSIFQCACCLRVRLILWY